MIKKIYQWLLWYSGFQENEFDDDTISNMLDRQEERMGKWWWCFPITTMLFTACMLGFQIWLTIHIIKMGIKGK